MLTLILIAILCPCLLYLAALIIGLGLYFGLALAMGALLIYPFVYFFGLKVGVFMGLMLFGLYAEYTEKKKLKGVKK